MNLVTGYQSPAYLRGSLGVRGTLYGLPEPLQGRLPIHPANNYYNYYPYGYYNTWNTLFPFGLPGFDGVQNWIYQSVG